MPNRLAQETSPYLLQHANNPVDWYPWGPEALARARDEQRPIFLSIGYAACHWCHVMEHESFEDPETAAYLNAHFVPVKVDREERPDLDALYMDAVQSMTGHGGWPMSVFLTPDGAPFFGGTYFPNVARYGMPSFRDVLEGVADAWAARRGEVQESGTRIAEAIAAGQRIRPSRSPPAADAAPAPAAPAPTAASAAPAAPAPTDAPAPVVPAADPTLDPATLDAAEARLADAFDWANGSWGGAPKFPQPMVLDFLLRRAVAAPDAATAQPAHAPGPYGATAMADDPRRARLLRMVTKTLDAMADGGIRDQLGGGFHRYSTDEVWLAPHFEKMLYDNAQLARVYLHAWQVTGERRYREVVESTVDYVAREMTLPGGGFAASQDADSEGEDGHPEEGAFYVWTAAEVETALAGTGLAADVPLVATTYDVRPIGNWEGKTILRRVRSDTELEALIGSRAADSGVGAADPSVGAADSGVGAADPSVGAAPMVPGAIWTDHHGGETSIRERAADSTAIPERLSRARQALFEAREGRVRPARDGKVLASWNGLMLAAVAEAARALGRDDYLALAERNAAFALEHLRTAAGRVRRSWKDGRATLNGYLEDYANLAEGLLALYETTFDPRWFAAARELADEMLAHFADPEGGFFDTSDDHETLVARPKGPQDNAVPSGNAMAVTVLLKLAAWTGEGRYRDAAESALRLVEPFLGRYPTGFGQWLSALDFALAPVREIAIVGDPGADATRDLLAVARAGYRPHQVVAVGSDDSGGSAPLVPLLADRSAVDGRATAYVCRGFVCERPVTDPDALAALL